MSDRKQFKPVTSSDSPSRADMPEHADSKTQPAKTGLGDNYASVHHGKGKDFNIKGKVTNPGSTYNNLDSGAHFNGAEKDASIAYLDKRGKQGMKVASYSSTDRNGRSVLGHDGSNHGLTAYNSSPIPETYRPATSNGQSSPNAIQYKNKTKGRGNAI